MGSLFSRKKARTKRVLLLGLDGAGKTTLLQNMITRPKLADTYPTIGFNVERIEYEDVKYELWDIGGQAKLRSMWNNHFESSQVIIYVVDSNDTDRLEEAKEVFQGVIQDGRTLKISIVLIANKQDLPHAMKASHLYNEFKLNTIGRKTEVLAVSAVTGSGISNLKYVIKNLIC